MLGPQLARVGGRSLFEVNRIIMYYSDVIEKPWQHPRNFHKNTTFEAAEERERERVLG